MSAQSQPLITRDYECDTCGKRISWTTTHEEHLRPWRCPQRPAGVAWEERVPCDGQMLVMPVSGTFAHREAQGKKARLRLKVKHLRAELAALHETHRRTKKSEHTLQVTVGRLQARVRQLEDRGFHRDHWKSDAPLQPDSIIYVKLGERTEELKIIGVNWSREAEPQWTIRCESLS